VVVLENSYNLLLMVRPFDVMEVAMIHIGVIYVNLQREEGY
jgi:hypothetical protein